MNGELEMQSSAAKIDSYGIAKRKIIAVQSRKRHEQEPKRCEAKYPNIADDIGIACIEGLRGRASNPNQL